MSRLIGLIQLGDIIRISAPNNKALDKMTAFVNYYDPNDSIEFVHTVTMQSFTMSLKNGHLQNDFVDQIIVLNRSQYRGYALQNGLLPSVWVELTFKSDVKTIVTAKVLRIEEDMVEFISHPDETKFFIDFAYKGIPKNVPLKGICFCDPPISYSVNKDTESDQDDDSDYGDIVTGYNDLGEFEMEMPEEINFEKDYRETLYQEKQEDVSPYKEEHEYESDVPMTQLKYTLDIQLNTLLDELLSELPENKRSKKVMKKVYTHINRFKELREQYSTFDSHNQILSHLTKNAITYKPLHEQLYTLSKNADWVIPIATIIKDAYFNENADETVSNLTETQTEASFLEKEQELLDTYWEGPRYTGNNIQYQETFQELSERFLEPFQISTTPNITRNLAAKSIHVKKDVDMIISGPSNDLKFPTIVSDKTVINYKPYVTQRFVSPIYFQHQTKNKREFKPLMTGDKVDLHSLIFLPEKYVNETQHKFGNILHQSMYKSPYLFLIFQFYKKIVQNPSLSENDIVKHTLPGYVPHPSSFQHITVNSTDDVINDNYSFPVYNSLLNTSIPSFMSLFKHYYKNQDKCLNFEQYLRVFSSFMIDKDSLSFKSQSKIKEHIKKNLYFYNDDFIKKQALFTNYSVSHFPRKSNVHHLYLPMFEKYFSYTHATQANDIKRLKKIYDLYKIKNNSELYFNMSLFDNSKLFYSLLLFKNRDLITPYSMSTKFLERKHFFDTNKSMLSKKYSSLDDLQKDNNVRELHYDEKYDANDYSIITKYKKQQSKLEDEEFELFLREKLADVHGCSIENVEKLAQELIVGFKVVKEGDYALLEIRPNLPPGINECELSEKEKEMMEIEAKSRKIDRYFKRIENVWVYDSEANGDMFEKPINLTCKLTDKGSLDFETEKLVKSKYGEEMIVIKRNIEKIINKYENNLFWIKEQNENETVLFDSIQRRLGNEAYMGEQLVSPQYENLQKITKKNRDFEVKQNDIVMFSYHYCRDPLPHENPNWKYCKSTSLPLLAMSLFKLAKSYVNTNSYLKTFNELIEQKIIIKKDGFFIDKTTSVILDDIEFSELDLEMNEEVVSEDIVVEEMSENIETYAFTEKEEKRVYSGTRMKKCYNYFSAICKNLFLRTSMVENTVMELVYQTINNKKAVMSEASFKAFKEQESKKTKPIKQTYEEYESLILLEIVTSCLLVTLQTLTPSFRPRKTFGDCIIDVSGWPLSENSGNNGTLLYFACILQKMRGDRRTLPWSELSKKKETIQSKLKYIIDNHLLSKDHVKKMILIKREYMENESTYIPDDLSVASRWERFLPPIYKIELLNNKTPLRNLDKSKIKELEVSMSQGHHNQWSIIGMLYGKLMSFTYGSLQIINEIIEEKGKILGKFGNRQLIENACCHERDLPMVPLRYFENEDDRLQKYLSDIRIYDRYLFKLKSQSKAKVITLKTNTNTMGTKDTISDYCHYSEQLMYKSIISFCNLDSKTKPIPLFLQDFLSSKFEDYDPKQSLEEKINFLKEREKRINTTIFTRIMKKIYQNNIIQLPIYIQISQNEINSDNVNDWINNSKQPDTQNISQLLASIFETNDEEPKDIDNKCDDLENKIYEETKLLSDKLISFLDELRVRKEDKTKIIKILTFKDVNTMIFNQFVKNYMYYLCVLMPSYLINNHTMPEKTNLKKLRQLLPKDVEAMEETLQNKYKKLFKFKDDDILKPFLENTVDELKKMYSFYSQYVSFFPSNRESLYRRFGVYMIYNIFNYLITMTNHTDLLRIITKKIDNNTSSLVVTDGIIQEIELTTADKSSIKTKVLSFIQSLLDLEGEFVTNKSNFVFNYKDIEKNVERVEEKEKIRHMSVFAKIKDNKTRRAERDLEKYHLGRFFTDPKVIKQYGNRRNKMLDTVDTEEDFILKDYMDSNEDDSEYFVFEEFIKETEYRDFNYQQTIEHQPEEDPYFVEDDINFLHEEDEDDLFEIRNKVSDM